ncbi:MAG: PKD domain-containing protein [Saprospiraceae bacterium]
MILSPIKALLVLFFTMLAILPIKAKHIIGGDMSYTCISNTATMVTLQFQLILYRDQRDAEGAQCDDDAEFGIWQGETGAWIYFGKSNPQPFQQAILNEILNPPCADAGGGTASGIPPNEQCIYNFELTLPKINQNYLIAYQRCCRNEAISNVLDPGGFGALFSIEITPEALDVCNNSPKFNDYKTAIFCTNENLIIDNNASDIDGDSVVYKFCIPISAGGRNSNDVGSCDFVQPNPELCGPAVFREVRFRSPGFSFDVPLEGAPNLELNTTTGLLKGMPVVLGEYVMAVCAEEYRDGILFTSIRRDLQVIITDCTPKDALLSVSAEDEPFVLNTGPNGELPGDPDQPLDDIFIVRVCGQTNVEFNLNNRSIPYETESFMWFFNLGDKIVTSNDPRPNIDFPGIGVYEGFMVIDPDSPPCSDTARVEVTILPTVEANFEISFDDCRAGEIKFKDNSITRPSNATNVITEWNWDFGDGNTSNLQEPTHFYDSPGKKLIKLNIFDNNGCNHEFQELINWFPVPVPKVAPDGFLGCSPQTFFFDNLSKPLDENYMIEWDFGDGTEGPERFDISPSHTYTDPGVYDVSLSIKSPIEGCEEYKKFNDLITVIQGFEADFDIAPEKPSFVGQSVHLSNRSDIGATSYVWDIGEHSTTFIENPSFVVADTGKFDISLLVTWENGCTDKVTKEIEIVPCIETRFPNAFTPNGDGRNEEFKGVIYGFKAINFDLSIYDRWGKLIFNTNDPKEGWNGKYLNNGADLPPGVYMYNVSFSNPYCEQKPKPGFATLIR